MSVSEKLEILSHERIDWAYHGNIISNFFMGIISDNPVIYKFLIDNLEDICLEEKPDNPRGFNGVVFKNRNLLLALKGDWEALNRRSLIFFECFT